MALKVGCFTDMDSTRVTQVLAVSILRSEDTTSFEWAFKNFSYSFSVDPKVIFTDGDLAMAAAIKEAWPATTYLLCTFHK